MAPKRHRSGTPASAAGNFGEGGSIDEVKLRKIGSEVRFLLVRILTDDSGFFPFSFSFLELLMCGN